MNEKDPNTSPENDNLTPEMAFNLVKTAQLFAQTLVSQEKEEFGWRVLEPIDIRPGEVLDSLTMKDRKYASFLDFSYRRKHTNSFLGDPKEWDTKLFSFKSREEEEGFEPQFSIGLPMEPTVYPYLEVYYSSGNRRVGADGGVNVRVPFEGLAEIQYTKVIDKSEEQNGTYIGKEGEWRPMTQAEGFDLLSDLTFLLERLNTAIENGEVID